MNEIVTYKHEVNSGDLIASLPGVKHVYDELGKKAIIFQRLNLPVEYYQNAKHPVKDKNGIQVAMNERQWEMLKPLLLSQAYIKDCIEWRGQDADIDFSKIHNGDYTTKGFGSINRWPFYVHPLLACDLSKPWLEVEDNEKIKQLVDGKILLNFTCRYRNPLVSYFFLKKWEDKLIFSGTKEEHEVFCGENDLNMPYLQVDNFLEVAQAVKHCKIFLGCQSMIWNIAEAMKKLRVLEVCKSASNCVPNGANGYDYLHQGAVEVYMNKFMK